MFKFIKKVSLYFLILLVLILILNYHYEQTLAPNYVDKFISVPEQIRLFNLGSSHGLCDFCYDEIEESIQCFNFGMQSQTLSYDYRMLQQYSENIDGGFGLIVVSYFSLFEEEESQNNFLTKNARYYRFMEPKYIKQYDPIVDLCVRYLPVLSSNENPISIMMKKPDKKNQFEIDWRRTTSQDAAEEDAKGAVERHVFSYRNEEGWRINQEEINALKDMIIFCHKRNIECAMIVVPYLGEYNEKVPKEFKKYFDEVLNAISVKYEVEYYDYSMDERFQGKYEWFMNSDHLNRIGAINFTRILWEDFLETDFL